MQWKPAAVADSLLFKNCECEFKGAMQSSCYSPLLLAPISPHLGCCPDPLPHLTSQCPTQHQSQAQPTHLGMEFSLGQQHR